MGDRINGVSTNGQNTDIADINYYQPLGLRSHVYSFDPGTGAVLKRVVDGHAPPAAPITEGTFFPAIGWLLNDNNPVLKAIGWLLTLITGGTIIGATMLTRKAQTRQYTDTTPRNIFERFDGGVASEALTAAKDGLAAYSETGFPDAERLERTRQGLIKARKALKTLERAERDLGKGRKR